MEQEVTFTSGADTIYGSLLAPTSTSTSSASSASRVPAALLLAGSGPTDRNGDSTILNGPVTTLRNFAFALAGLGIASLRYDKLGSGKTGLGSHAADPGQVGFDLFVDEARDAYALLRSRPEIDPNRILLLGHSEGGLIALVLADQVRATTPVRALVLASPLSAPYLETIRRQITAQYALAQQAGAIVPEQAADALAELDAIIARLLDTGNLPQTITTPALKTVFTPANSRFLAQVARYDPASLASELPASLPVLILRGEKDEQVNSPDVQRLLAGFRSGGNTNAALFELGDVNHVFKEVPGIPNPAMDYVNPDLPFSTEAVRRLNAFVQAL